MPKHPLTFTPSTSPSLAAAVETALATAQRHHAVVVVETVGCGWRVEVVPTHISAEFAQRVSEGLQALNIPAIIDVWEQHEDVAASSAGVGWSGERGSC